MTTTESSGRRVRVTYEPTPGSRPWRAVIVSTVHDLPWQPVPVGRFDTAAEAATTGVSALRFVSAGIPWRPVGMQS